MAQTTTAGFLTGVIEGFYGPPWNAVERATLFRWMADWGLNTYFYAPKDDLRHRALWRESYAEAEAASLRQLIADAQERRLRFIYGLSPGLDLRYDEATEVERLKARFAQMQSLGCEHFALLFDDVPDRLDGEVIHRWGSLAGAQAQVANILFRWAREHCPSARFLFCPAAYCGRMAAASLGGENYLPILGRELLPEIDVVWTGPEIISREITVAHVLEWQAVLRRKPLIWDNLPANDYDGRRCYLGPYAGRPPELRDAVRGLLVNPNTEFPLNYVPLSTFAAFIRCADEWDARQAYLAAMREWLPHFDTVGQPVALEDLILFGDCYYLPHEEGAEAEKLFQLARTLLAEDPATWSETATTFRQYATRLRDFCVRTTELRDRPLFHALSRRVWELREELDLLERYVEFRSQPANRSQSFTSDYHRPGTYRGGFVTRLQRLLTQNADGTFLP